MPAPVAVPNSRFVAVSVSATAAGDRLQSLHNSY